MLIVGFSLKSIDRFIKFQVIYVNNQNYDHLNLNIFYFWSISYDSSIPWNTLNFWIWSQYGNSLYLNLTYNSQRDQSLGDENTELILSSLENCAKKRYAIENIHCKVAFCVRLWKIYQLVCQLLSFNRNRFSIFR